MLSSINPLGERARGQKFGLTAVWYLIGSALGGLVIGGLSGWVGVFIPYGDAGLAAVAVLCFLGAIADLTGRRFPSIHRQVDENWLTRYRGWVYGVGFGFQLGLGVVTIVTTASVYVLIGVAAITRSPALGGLLGMVFGLARAVVIAMVMRVQDAQSLRDVMRRLQPRLTAATVTVFLAQAVTGIVIMSFAL